jgi:hypothetical protein
MPAWSPALRTFGPVIALTPAVVARGRDPRAGEQRSNAFVRAIVPIDTARELNMMHKKQRQLAAVQWNGMCLGLALVGSLKGVPPGVTMGAVQASRVFGTVHSVTSGVGGISNMIRHGPDWRTVADLTLTGGGILSGKVVETAGANLLVDLRSGIKWETEEVWH